MVDRPRLVPVGLQLEFQPMKLLIHPDFQEMSTLFELTYTLQWEDARLFQHPCFGALEQMLSMDVEAGRSDNGRFAKNLILNRF